LGFCMARCCRRRNYCSFIPTDSVDGSKRIYSGVSNRKAWFDFLSLIGIIPTFQPAYFGRVYARVWRFFIVLSLLWGRVVDRNVPDFFDNVGGAVNLLGVAIIMYWPR